MTKTVIGWTLDRGDRARLLAELPARYAQAVADHVTLKSGVAPDAQPPADTVGEIVGIADDGVGVQALVVRIDGSTARPGGGVYHITWSLAPGREPRESNDVIQRDGWIAIDPHRTVSLKGARFPP